MPIHTRPREKLMQKGVANLKDKELLAILFRTGSKGKNAIELADDFLKKYTNKQIRHLSFQEVHKVSGIDVGKYCILLAALEFSKRLLESTSEELSTIAAPADALPYLTTIKNLKKEYFIALYMNARNQVIHQETISIGTLTASLVHPREVFEPAVRVCAGSIIIAHNHPSGDMSPSDQDIRITKQLQEAGRILNIEIVDHLIIATKGHISLKEKGFI